MSEPGPPSYSERGGTRRSRSGKRKYQEQSGDGVSHSTNTGYPCEVCGRVLPLYSELLRHKERAHGISPVKKAIASTRAPSKINRSQSVSHIRPWERSQRRNWPCGDVLCLRWRVFGRSHTSVTIVDVDTFFILNLRNILKTNTQPWYES